MILKDFFIKKKSLIFQPNLSCLIMYHISMMTFSQHNLLGTECTGGVYPRVIHCKDLSVEQWSHRGCCYLGELPHGRLQGREEGQDCKVCVRVCACVCVCVRVCVHASMHFCFYLSMHEVSNVKNYQSVQSMSSSLQAGAKVTEGKLHP